MKTIGRILLDFRHAAWAGLVVFFLPFLNARAQNSVNALTDSLIASIPGHKEDTFKVNLLLDISFYLASNNPDQAIEYGQQATQLSKKLSFQPGLAGAYRNIGLGYSTKSEFITALNYFLKALKIYEKINNQGGIAKVTLSIGQNYSNTQDFVNAEKYLLLALKKFELLGIKNGSAKTRNNLGVLYTKLKRIDEALQQFQQAIAIREELGDIRGNESTISNMANIYMDRKEYERSLDLYFQALAINRLSENQSYKAVHLSSIGNLYLAIVKEDRQELLNKLFQGNSKKALNLSKVYLDSAIVLFEELHDLSDVQLFYKSMSEVEELLQNYPASLAYYKKFDQAKDSVFNAENTRAATEMRLGFEFEKKQQADSLQTVQKNKIYELTIERQRTFTYLVLAVLILLVMVLYLLFRHRNRIAIEKKRSEDLLLNILPLEVANSLKEKGESEPRDYEHVSVLFTDFVGFSQISEKLSARELVDEIHLYFSAFDAIISKHGLEKIKTIGDAYLAVSGLPHEESEHAIKVVEAARDLLSFIDKRRSEGGKFQVRIGIHSGHVVAGIVGTKKFAFDIWGDTVNTASRMESHGEPGKICISAQTYNLIKHKIACSSRGILQVKGKGPMELFFVD